MSAAAKWHREQAKNIAAASRSNRDFAFGYYKRQADLARHIGRADAEDAVAAHHATAATALDALAVPGVAELIHGLSGDRGYEKTDAQRAALATLAKIGRGE